MPRRYTAKRRIARKGKAKLRYRKGRKNRSTLNRIVAKFPYKNAFPRQYMCKMHYSDSIDLTGTVLRSRDHVFSVNNLYDPDFTATGHQPRFYDQLAGIYSAYRVVGAKIRLQLIPTNQGTTSQNMWLGLVANNLQTSLSDSTYLNVSELPHSKCKYTNFYNGVNRVSMYVPVHRVAGVAKSVVRNSDDFSGTGDGVVQPVKRSNFHCLAGLVNEFSSTIEARMLVDITYYVIWERPQTPASS